MASAPPPDADEQVCPAYALELPSTPQQAPITGRNQVPSSNQIGYDWASQPLEPSEVRWFFEDIKIKNRWVPFMGGDSIALESQYRVNVSGQAAQKVFVRGKLYEVNVEERTCKAIYWPEEVSRIVRGSWFNIRTWQPLAEDSAAKLEQKHAELYPYGTVSKVAPRKPSEKPKALGKVQLEDCYVEWYSPVTMHAFKQSVVSKVTRSIGVDLLGMSKTNQSDGILSRGFCEVARHEDVIGPVNHLLFVVHGIAQKTTAEINLESIAKNQVHHMCSSTRNLVSKYQKELYPDVPNHRVEFLPIEWRSKIKLDEGVLDSVTLRKFRRIRELGNASVLDVLFYTSPLYTEEILDTVVKEIRRQYSLFLEYNPEFLANGGKVSLIGHSLGSVICFDILRNYRTMDDLVAKLHDLPVENVANLTAEVAKYYELKTELLKLEQTIAKPYYDSFGPRRLPFAVENYYAVGSPLGCFLAVRGVKPSLNGSIDDLLPKAAAKRFYNLFHAYDPVAFRLEPLLLPHYKKVKPILVHAHSLEEKPPYEELQQQVYDDDEESKEMQEMMNQSSGNSKNGAASTGLNMLQKEIKKGSRSMKSMVAEPMYSRSGVVGGPHSEEQSKFPDDAMREMHLEFRVDYELRTQKSITDFYTGYSTAPTAHIQYWESKDTAVFFLQTLMLPIQSQPISRSTKKFTAANPADAHL